MKTEKKQITMTDNLLTTPSKLTMDLDNDAAATPSPKVSLPAAVGVRNIPLGAHNLAEDTLSQNRNPESKDPTNNPKAFGPSVGDAFGGTYLDVAARRVPPTTPPSPPPCSCTSEQNIAEQRALTVPSSIAPSFGTLTRTLMCYGRVEGISFDAAESHFTVVFECGCLAKSAWKNLSLKQTPYVPAPNLTFEYIPKKDCKDYLDKSDGDLVLGPPPPLPRFFRLTPKGQPSIPEIMVYLRDEMGALPPNCLTRLRSDFLLRVNTDSQSCRVSMLNLGTCPVLKNVEPHQELNSSKAICHNRELYITEENIIKKYSTPIVKGVYKVKGRCLRRRHSNNSYFPNIATSKIP